MSRDNAPINITHHAETFIYLYSSLERKRKREKEKEREEEKTRGRRQAEFYLWPIRLINNARRCPLCLSSSLYHRKPLFRSSDGRSLACMANGVEKLIRSLTNRIRNSATRARRVPREQDVKG